MHLCKYFTDNKHKGPSHMHKKDHVLGHKRLHKSKSVKIIQKAFSDHNTMNSIINTK